MAPIPGSVSVAYAANPTAPDEFPSTLAHRVDDFLTGPASGGPGSSAGRFTIN